MSEEQKQDNKVLEKIEVTYDGQNLSMNSTLDSLKTLFVLDMLKQNIIQDMQNNSKITTLSKPPIIGVH